MSVAGQWIYEFEYRDYQNNLRVAFKENGNQLVQTQTQEQDPWGLEIKPLSYLNSINYNNFKFLNRLDIVELNGVSDLVNRFYDKQNGRFWSTDPKVDDGQHSFTPFHYSFNNPIRFSEPSGLMGQDCCGDDPSQDPFIFAKLALTAFYDTKQAIYNATFRPFGSDLRPEYKVENDSQVFETEFSRKPFDNSLKGGIREAVSAVADVVSIIPGGSTEGKLLAETSKSQTSRAVKAVVAETNSGKGVP